VSRRFLVLLVGALAVGCQTTPLAPPLTQVEPSVPLIPLERLVSDRLSPRSYRVSPDGTRLGWIEGRRGYRTVRFEILATGNKGSIETYASGHVDSFAWGRDSRRVLYELEEGENRHVYVGSTERPDAPPVNLTPWAERWSRIHRVPHADPAHVIVKSGLLNAQVYDLYRIDLRTGNSTRLTENSGDVREWLADEHGTTRARLRELGAAGGVLEVNVGDQWRELQRYDLEEFVHARLLRADADASRLWLLSHRGRDRLALVRVDTVSGAESIVYEHPHADVAEVSLGPSGPLLALTHPDYPALEFLDPVPTTRLRAILPEGPAALSISSLSDDGRWMTARVETDRRITQWLIDHKTGERRRLDDSSQQLPRSELAAVEPILFTSRDGVRLHGYLTRPPGLAGPTPMVVLVHGGPWKRDAWGANPFVQVLANRGYAVLQVNFRGSTGYGRAFRELGIGEWGRKMQADLIDGVRWAVAQGVADPARVAIYGGSYGGYAALVGMTFTPHVFACGVALAPVTNLVSFLESPPTDFTEAGRSYWRRHVGDPSRVEDHARIKATSALFRADRARGPLLIMHGEGDKRVRPEQSEVMVSALQRAGKRVNYVTMRWEGHEFYNPLNQRRHLAEVEDFLSRCLGGRAPSFPDAPDYNGLIESGWALLRAGRPHAALERARSAERLYPAEFEAYDLGVMAATWANELDSARSVLHAALERAPDHERYRLYSFLRDVDPAAAKAAFEQRVQAARAALQRGDVRAAALEYYDAWRVKPDEGGVGLEAAPLLVETGDYLRAGVVLFILVRSVDSDVVRRARPWIEKVEKVMRSTIAAHEHIQAGRHSAAIASLRDPEVERSAWAMRLLGTIHENGLGVAKNEAEAVRWYLKAAGAGAGPASTALGRMYASGRGVARDDAEAIRWFQRGADAGDADAMERLGWMYESLSPPTRDYLTAVRWYRRASGAGNAQAKVNLGVMYRDGRGLARDEARALALFREAAEAGQSRGMYLLGRMYSDGRGAPQDDAEAVRWYRQAAVAGDDDAMHHLGWMHETARGVARSDSDAAHWYRRASDAGNHEGRARLGIMYADGRGVSRDDAKAVELFRQAAEAGSPLGMAALALMYEMARGVGKDHAEAARWYRKAADAGSIRAKTRLGILYFEGRGLPGDDGRAVELFREAAGQDDAEAMEYLGHAYRWGRGVNQDETEATWWYRRAAEAGLASSMYQLARMYEHGLGLAKDAALALSWYRKAAEAGDREAIKILRSLGK
jgi:TPR repeat protein/dipeptidyl aminopeptidase/acylaminoacyl peptidase